MGKLGLRLVTSALLTVVVGCGGCGDDDGMTPDAGMIDGSMGMDAMIPPGDPGIEVTPTEGLETNESGTTTAFAVRLLSMPNADVTVPITSGDETEGTVGPASLVFTPDNWDAPQMITVTGVDDDEADGDQTYEIAVGPATSDDADYEGLNGASVEVTNVDDESAGVTVTPTEGLETTEAGGTADFTVVLNTAPSADVVIGLATSDDTEGTPSADSLTFTVDNWDAPQTVTVTGVDDDEADGPVEYSIEVAAAVSEDAAYMDVDGDDVSLTNLDDESAGVVVEPTEGLMTTEDGGEAEFTVVLLTAPTADVTIALSSSDASEGTVSPESLVFTSENWNAPQTVTVTGVDDADVDGNQLYDVVTAAAVSDDAEYMDLDADDVAVINIDNETAGVTVDPLTGLVTTEAGGTDTFTVVLNSAPTADVTIPVSSSDDTEGGVSPATLTFTVDNWDAPQTVTVTGIDDDVADGDQPYMGVLGAATSTDANYDGVDPADVMITNTDDETPGITVSDISGDTGEDGTSATFTVVLNTEPTADVTIPLSSSDEGEGTVAPATLTFTPDNWNAAQEVTVTGADDALVDGNQPYTIVTGAATSGDPNYDARDAADVAVINIDDDSAGIRVTPVDGLVTNESGTTATFTVVLNSAPTADVTVPLSSDDTGEGTVSPASLVFTMANWDAPQTVTITGVDDPIADGDQGYRILTAPATSTDANYDGLDAANVAVTNVDNDSASISVSPTSGLRTTEGGGTDTFEVVLNSQPSADVSITLASDDDTEGTAAPATLTFTAANWNAPQTVTVTGVDDAVADGNQTYTIVLDPASSGDGDYDGLDPTDVEVRNTDNDSPGVTVTLSDAVSDEGGDTASIRVVLNSRPTDDVTITPMSLDTSEGTVVGGALTFTFDNWDAPQTFSVRGEDDDVADGNQVYEIGYDITSVDSGYDGLVAPRSPLQNLDDDSPGVLVTITDTMSGEDGATAEIEVVLQSEPMNDVTIALTSTDATEGTPRSASVMFTTANWSSPQTVLIDGVDDDVADGNQRYRINWDASSVDLAYDAFSNVTGELTNVDDDSPGLGVTIIDDTTGEAGGTATLEVVLQSEPMSNVVVSFASDDTSEGVVTGGAMLTFTPANWNSVQTVTITGVDDFVADGNPEYGIDYATTTTDPGYAPLAGTAFPITNIDDDSAGITWTLSDRTSSERGNTARFTIVLESQPTADVRIDFTSADATEAESPASVTFNDTNWSSPVTVTVVPVDDAIADGRQDYAIDYVAVSTDSGYSGRTGRIETFRNVDDDSAGVSVTVVDGTTSETGDTGSVQFVLESEPVANVTLNLLSDQPDEGMLGVSSLTFTSSDWDMPQSVMLTGVDDFIADGNQRYQVDYSITSADATYAALAGSSPDLTNIDDDTAGFTVEVTDAETGEDGAAGRFTVVLNSQPTASVSFDLVVLDATEGVLITASPVVIDAASWASPRLVTVGGVDDAVTDGDVPYQVRITPSSGDAAYDSLAPQLADLTNRDDDSASILVTPVDSETDEDGDTATFEVILDSQPSGDVSFSVASNLTVEGVVTDPPGGMITFTPATWRNVQTVTITGVDDALDDGDVAYTIVNGVSSSSDPEYDGLNVDDVDLVNIDNDVAGIRFRTRDRETNEDGDLGNIEIRLRTVPAATVTVTVTSSDTTEGQVVGSGVLTFDAGNWDVWQQVDIEGQPDFIVDGDTLYQVRFSSVSADGAYDAISRSRLFTNFDNESTTPSFGDCDTPDRAPDAFGHGMYGSPNATFCNHGFVDITDAGTQVFASDEAIASIGLVAPINFYGTMVSSLSASSNGWLGTATPPLTNPDWTNDCGGVGYEENRGIRMEPFWDDLDGSVGEVTGLYTQNFGSCPRDHDLFGPGIACTIVQWSAASWEDESSTIFDVEVFIYETSDYVFAYRGPVWETGGSASIGLRDIDGGESITWSCNTAGSATGGSSVCIYGPDTCTDIGAED